ncbi:MAG TPA: hypothetical protein VHA56_04470 [Mucilaginibacter sp.]|nr:hypothetical protein [Mucilaginibacter sp.]
MNRYLKNIPSFCLLLVLFTSLIFTGSCRRRHVSEREREETKRKAEVSKAKALIKSIQGIRYTEVKRTFDNGLSFSPVGYQLIPEWRIAFTSVDSVSIYSPKKKHFINTPVVFDHDSIYNIAWAWLKLKYIKKDSMKFEVLHVDGRVIKDEDAHAFMTFYTNDYIMNVLHADTNKKWQPNRADTAYIMAKALMANKFRDSAFAATEPAVLKPVSPLIKIKKEVTPIDDPNGGKPYDDYLSPTYDITIHHAYTDFFYTYTAFVDEKGVIIFRKSMVPLSDEFKKPYNEAMKGITDGYLNTYLKVSPGKTLGIPHTSIIFLNVTGVKK